MALFIGGATIAFWMHYTAILLVGCAVTIGVLLVISAAPAGKRALTALNFALMGLAVLVVWTPCILFLSYILGPVSDDGALHTPNIISSVLVSTISSAPASPRLSIEPRITTSPPAEPGSSR